MLIIWLTYIKETSYCLIFSQILQLDIAIKCTL